MNHRAPRIVSIRSDVVASILHFVLEEEMSWTESLDIHRISLTELVDDFRDAGLIEGYTPLVTQLCQKLSNYAYFFPQGEESMLELLDTFRFHKALIEGREVADGRL